LDLAWLEQNLARIFPEDDASKQFYKAAWHGFIRWIRFPTQRVFRLLQKQYARAVDTINPEPGQKGQDDSDSQLARHLMVVFWHDEIEAEGEESLLGRFFATAPDSLRAEAIRFVGLIIGEQEAIPESISARLKQLREIRRGATRSQPEHRQEQAAFATWIVSGKLDESWSLLQIRAILQGVGKVELEHQVVEWLGTVSPRFPYEALECLSLMAANAGWDYHVSHWTQHANVVLASAMRDTRPETRKAAVNLINLLGSHGHHQFRVFLQSPDTPSQ
jgi:hypothetical protein